ncbi:hypothetical protein AKJ09_08180 [Labilithrix luteola]|uniref:Mycothiol-dependent maleylpyruvate isomerase metal-binding domain-containing protein n=1 Tax=Labilithrix luteola TaxID=1391654 RepID=A0A0K1Q780_9BACT|nr:maleylpyruvate isomerase N-terminal domain-containing protein [Labilithrix luteola]AKV01517.1 hypothetical protein AKJ09_08180 [Labilithrix luteola]
MYPRRPLHLLEELREINTSLLDLLGTLSTEDWSKPTIHADRTVKDLTSHLLDGSLRRLSMQRDEWTGERFEGKSYEELVAFIQRLNRDWMLATRRLSPAILTKMIADADADVLRLFESLDPQSPALFSVAWAGESTSTNWFDIAREYTEKWHHQAQLRDALGRPSLRSRRHLHPVLVTFALGLPHAYGAALAEDGATVQIVVTGDAGDTFCLTRRSPKWVLEPKIVAEPTCELVMEDDVAWRLWTKGLGQRAIREKVEVTGDEALAEPALHMTCIMA